MVWKIDQPYKVESQKIVWEVVQYLKGDGIDVGAGMFKILPQALSVDNGDHEKFNQYVKPDVRIRTAEDMSIFASRHFNYVYSSHLLEHMPDPAKALKEWWRLVKPGGYLVLYLPHEDLYPKVGEEGANPLHLHNLNEEKVINWMIEAGGKFDLERCEQRNNDDEYSFLMVFKRTDKKHTFSYKDIVKPEKTACVVRYGAFGDLMQTSTVLAGLKKQGYHVTVFCSPPGSDVIMHDPHIDKFVYFEKDQVPNPDLVSFWAHQAKNFDRFVNLSETVEGTLLALPLRAAHPWTPAARHMTMNHNYVELMHKVAGVPHDPQIKFYRSPEEKEWARKTRVKIPQKNLIIWSLAGSSVHKTWAGLDNVVASILVQFPDTAIALVGGPECEMLEAGWEEEPRVIRTCGVWNIRQSLSMLYECDLVIGPETGVLNAACCMDIPKIIFLSHSTVENLTRDWKNTTSLWSRNTTCKGRGANSVSACHMLHYGFDHCTRHEESGTAQCQADITIGEVWEAVAEQLTKIDQRAA